MRTTPLHNHQTLTTMFFWESKFQLCVVTAVITCHAINRFGSNILNTIAVYSLYKRVVYLSVLYGSELLNNMKTKDTNNLQIFQHFIAKHIQSFNRRTRSDVCEAILWIESLLIIVKKRKRVWTLHRQLTKTNIYLLFTSAPL